MMELRSGDAQGARKTLHEVLKNDPHYAKAHFRLGEIALFNRNFPHSISELELALNDAVRLDAREQQLARLGIAISARDRAAAQEIARQISRQWPGDPDLEHIRREFGGMTGEGQRPFGRRRQRP
jgi:Tfp pilus assembly protein PilF